MKKLVRTIFAMKLAYMARIVLHKYKPAIVMITGSVGKTSTKDAIAAVLSEQFFIRASEKSYNSEFGVPLTILGAKNPWAHPTYWIKTFFEAWKLILLKNHYPKVLVLEVGADRPGDLARILNIATPDVVVVTQLPALPVHVEAYAGPAAVREEEFAPAYALAPDAPLIVSSDDTYARALAEPLSVKVSMFGDHKEALVQITEEKLHLEEGVPVGMACVLLVEGASYPLVVRGALGRPQLLAPAAAIATGLAFGMKIERCLKGAESYLPPPGRGRILHGLNKSTLIDDSYNSSPAAVEEGLTSLTLLSKTVSGARKIAVLGDMLELGRYSHEEHEKIGKLVAKKADLLVTVGIRARTIAESAKASGMHEDAVQAFGSAKEAAEYLLGIISWKDVVLIKGSQSVRTEKIVEALLAEPSDRKFLVRQDKEWRAR